VQIKIENLHFSYSDSPTLHSVDLSIDEGKNYAVMGRNGSGKTTLLKILAGLYKPDSGELKVPEGLEIGFSPEDPELGFFEKTVKKEIEFYPRNLGLDHEKLAAETLEKIGISGLQDKLPTILSSGQQRLVSIASVLSGRPDILLLDEPTHSLHRKGEKILGKLLEKFEQTIVFTTHSSDFALEFADKVIVMDSGTVLKVGDVRKVLNDDRILDKAGIRPPGPVAWARKNDIDIIPLNAEGAIEILKGGKD